MSEINISYLTDVVLITCVVAHGRGDEAVKVARETGVAGAIVYNARGNGLRERLGLLGVAVETEKEVVSMVVSTERRDLVMHNLYTQLGLDAPGAGVVYAVPMDKVATYIPAEVMQRLQSEVK